MWIAQRILYFQPDPCFSFVIEHFSLLILNINKISRLFHQLDKGMQQTIMNLQDHCRHFITGLFVLPYGLSLLDDMSTLAHNKFPWSLNSKCSKPHIPGVLGQCPPDVAAEESLLKLPLSWDTIQPLPLYRSTRLMGDEGVA